MTGAAVRTIGKAIGERARGVGPGRVRAFAAAVVTGMATAVLTYRVLRSDSLTPGTRES
jgi:hypothetical protein